MSASAEATKGRDTLMKMLLTTTNIAYKKNIELGDTDTYQSEDNLHETFVSYIRALTGSSKPVSLVWMEHSYARAVEGAAGVGGEGEGAARLLLVRRAPQCPHCHTHSPLDDCPIDVETLDPEPTPPLLLDEIPPMENMMEEGELSEEDENPKPDWEEKLHSLAWSHAQSSLLEDTLVCIMGARNAYLTAGRAGARRAAARGGAARCLRALLAAPAVRWQPRLTQWLHNALTEHLPPPLLAAYRDIMLTLKSKVPALVEKMTLGHPLAGRVRGAENGAGGPSIASGNTLGSSDPSAPLLLLLPSGRDRRDARWAERLRQVAQVHVVHSHQSNWPTQLPLSACLAQLVGAGRARAAALKAEHPHQPLVLVGQGAGAAIAVQLSVSISGVAGVVCLGLPLLTSAGPRGHLEDCLLDIPCPALFIIGQNASQCTQQDVEELRCKLRVRSRLVVAGGADELLRLPRLKRHLEGVTQRMLECAIADEVGSFLSCLLQWEAEGGGRSSPDSLAGEGEVPPPPASLLAPPPPSVQAAKRRISASTPSNSHAKIKKIRNKVIKSTSPIKGRGVALYQVNNPPPEGTSISMGQLLSTKVVDGDISESTNSLSPQPKKEPSSFIQISNNKLRTMTKIGNGTSELSSGSAIKVLENIPYKLPANATTRFLGSGTISSSGNTPLVLPRRNQPIQNTEKSPSMASTNIMDIPIIFADDEKSSTNSSVTHNVSPTSGIKTIIINKQQIISNSTKTDINKNPMPARNLVQVKMSPNSQLGKIITNSVQHKTINVKRSDMNKIIIAKRVSDPKATSPQTDTATIKKTQIITKPLLVKGKPGSMSTFQMFPSTVFRGSNVIKPKQLIIKRATGASAMKVNSSMAKKIDLLRENMKSDRAIEAAVASITGDQDSFDKL